jgi:carbon-monoxide dehydrogenase medium subunit
VSTRRWARGCNVLRLKPPPFAYHRPEHPDAVDDLLAEHGDEAKILAGGQSLLPILNMRLSSPARLIDINGLADQPTEPVLDDGVLRFAPLVRQGAVERWSRLADTAPLLRQALAFTAHPAIRNRGTLAGSVAHADPSAELPAALLALDGEVRCRSAEGTRTIPAREFFVGALETARRPTEWVDEVSVPVADEGSGYAVEEFARRHGDYAICGVMAVGRRLADGVAVALVHFGIADVPVRTDLGLLDSDVREEALTGVVGELLCDVEWAGDLHASARYRRRLAEVLGARAAVRAVGDAA